MSFDAKAVANFFLDLAKAEGQPLTPMKLQKLVYYPHGWRLGIVGKALLNEQIEAWEFGPVIPSLYHEFKEFGDQPITRKARKIKLLGGKRPGAILHDFTTVIPCIP